MVQEASTLKILRFDGWDAAIALRRSRRARHITLSLDPAEDHFSLVLPKRATIAEGLEFAMSRARWMQDKLSARPPRVPFADGAVVPILGHEHKIQHRPDLRGGAWCEDGTLLVTGQSEHLSRRVKDFLKKEAKQEAGLRAHAKAAEVDRTIARLTLRDTRSRWGSCTPTGHISLSWRLILAPEAVFDYVVAHEVAHLVHLNHGARFWALVGRLTEQVEDPRRWLRDQGATLWRFG